MLLDDGVRADASKQQPAGKQISKSRRRRCWRRPPPPEGEGPSRLKPLFGRNDGAANDQQANTPWLAGCGPPAYNRNAPAPAKIAARGRPSPIPSCRSDRTGAT